MNIRFFPRTVVQPAVPQQTHPLCLTRMFVETGDERCPLAGVWLRLDDSSPTAVEPERTQPVMRRLLRWRAFHPGFTFLSYSRG